MKNKKIRYCDEKPINEVVSNALILGKKKYCEWLGSQIETNEYRAFIKNDPVERAKLQIEKNNRKMQKLFEKIAKPEGFVEKEERLNKVSLKSPEEANDHG